MVGGCTEVLLFASLLLEDGKGGEGDDREDCKIEVLFCYICCGLNNLR